MERGRTLAIIGCGAIADQYYFPAIAARPDLREAVILVDPSRDRRDSAIRKFGFPAGGHVRSVHELPDPVALAINATPSHLHVETTLPLLARRIGVLLEKPFAERASDASTLMEARPGRCVLSANHYRRLMPSYRAIASLIKSGAIGEITHVSWREGHKFDWPTQSGFYFRRPWASGRPRGALLDIGVHIFDTICWWLDEAPVPVRAETDGCGGPEAYASAVLRSSRADVHVSISFHAKLSNTFLVEGTRGAVRGATSDFSRFDLRDRAGRWRSVAAPGPTEWTAIAAMLVGNCLEAVGGNEPLLIDAQDVIPGLAVIDALYALATDILPACYQEWVG